MRKIYEVKSSHEIQYNSNTRCHKRGSYIMSDRRAEEARVRAEEHLALERSGELHRRELLSAATTLQAKLREIKRKLRDIGADVSLLAPLLVPLPTEAAALEGWLAQATILHDATSLVLPDLIKAWQERELQRRAEEDRHQQQTLSSIRDIIEDIKDGRFIESEIIEWDTLEFRMNGILSRAEVRSLDLGYDRAIHREQLEADLCSYRALERFTFTKVERAGSVRPKAHRRGLDPDLRRLWRRERRSLSS